MKINHVYLVELKFIDRETSSLKLKEKSLLISDLVVHRVLGLPMGPKEIMLEPSIDVYKKWAEQFKPIIGGKIFPWMVCDKIKSDKSVTQLFKQNFLVILSNFLIESNQNSFMKRDILGLVCDLDACSQYNWCGFLVQKLFSAHEYWAENPSTRSFSGSLAFLIISYLSVYIYIILPVCTMYWTYLIFCSIVSVC